MILRDVILGSRSPPSSRIACHVIPRGLIFPKFSMLWVESEMMRLFLSSHRIGFRFISCASASISLVSRHAVVDVGWRFGIVLHPFALPPACWAPNGGKATKTPFPPCPPANPSFLFSTLLRNSFSLSGPFSTILYIPPASLWVVNGGGNRADRPSLSAFLNLQEQIKEKDILVWGTPILLNKEQPKNIYISSSASGGFRF